MNSTLPYWTAKIKDNMVGAGNILYYLTILSYFNYILFFRFKPRGLQCCVNPKALLASLAVVAFAQGFFAHGVYPSVLLALQRRFHFTMTDLGIIRMMHDVGLVVMLFPVMHFNARGK